MFKITENPEFTHEVTVMVPVDGGFDAQSFKARFLAISPEKMALFYKPDLGGDLGGDLGLLRKVVRALHDIVDDKGGELPYSDALLERMLALPYVRRGLVDAYVRGVSGARVKN